MEINLSKFTFPIELQVLLHTVGFKIWRGISSNVILLNKDTVLMNWTPFEDPKLELHFTGDGLYLNSIVISKCLFHFLPSTFTNPLKNNSNMNR